MAPELLLLISGDDVAENNREYSRLQRCRADQLKLGFQRDAVYQGSVQRNTHLDQILQ